MKILSVLYFTVAGNYRSSTALIKPDRSKQGARSAVTPYKVNRWPFVSIHMAIYSIKILLSFHKKDFKF